MTTQNWPDPKRPGVPMFPDYYGEHILKELVTGKEVPACWDANCPRNPGWDISALNSQTPETVALYFTYVRCDAIKLTPTQINEMLAAERERCAETLNRAARDTVKFAKRTRTDIESSVDYQRMIEIAATQKKDAEVIRNLGAAP